MRTRWLVRVLFTLVAIQLAFGVQLGVADAHPIAPVAASHEACQLHAAGAAGTRHTPSHHQHDCCKTSGCQGHCSTLPLAFNLIIPGGVPATHCVLVTPVPRMVDTRAETHFRPPIAS